MRKIVAGNWKMNTRLADGIKLAQEVIELSKSLPEDVELIIAPPFTHLSEIKRLTADSRVGLASQNCADMESGAFTGEVSADMLESIGVQYAIIGHSERRQYYGETSETLCKKIDLLFSKKITPIYCVGETKDERESGEYKEVVRRQIEEVVYRLYSTNFEKLIIAYEPVWAIGTGLTASSDQAEEMHAYIREVLHSKFGALAKSTPILYGGSCKPSNAQELFAKPNVDGGLIGGASLSANDFIGIAKSF